jgi:hypothetical protein
MRLIPWTHHRGHEQDLLTAMMRDEASTLDV